MLILSRPTGEITGVVDTGGSKSISNRALILAQVLDPGIQIKNLSRSADTLVLKEALRSISAGDPTKINVGDAGTSFRFLMALLAATPGKWELSGSPRLLERPIKPLLHSLKAIGAT